MNKPKKLSKKGADRFLKAVKAFNKLTLREMRHVVIYCEARIKREENEEEVK